MQILILGATGRTGTQVVLEALQSGHIVTALVRTPSVLNGLTSRLLDAQKANLNLVKGSPLNKAYVTNAITTAAPNPNSKLAHSNVRLTYDDHDAAEAELRAAGGAVRWVVLRPGRLTEGDDKNQAKVWPAEKGMVGMTASIARGAAARFSLDAAEESEWDGKDPIIVV